MVNIPQIDRGWLLGVPCRKFASSWASHSIFKDGYESSRHLPWDVIKVGAKVSNYLFIGSLSWPCWGNYHLYRHTPLGHTHFTRKQGYLATFNQILQLITSLLKSLLSTYCHTNSKQDIYIEANRCSFLGTQAFDKNALEAITKNKHIKKHLLLLSTTIYK